MSLFKEAARLADEFDAAYYDGYGEVGSAGKDLRDFCRTIAALDVSVEPVNFVDELEEAFTAAEVPESVQKSILLALRWDSPPLYTQQTLEEAVLKVHDAAIEKVADWYDTTGWELNRDDVADAIRALKGRP